MGSRWKNKGQGGGVSWGNKDSKIAQQKKNQVPRSAEAAAKAQTEKANQIGSQAGPLAEAAGRGKGCIVPSSSGLSNELENSAVAAKLWAKASSTDNRLLRVLCLHGHTQNGPLFKRKLAGLEKYVLACCPGGVQFTYPTGPHEAAAGWVEELDAEDRAVGGAAAQSRCWWTGDKENGELTGWDRSWKLLQDTLSRNGARLLFPVYHMAAQQDRRAGCRNVSLGQC